MTSSCSFVAYIDESGDEGFRFLPREQGSSRWFVISAVVFRISNWRAPITILERSRARLHKPPKYALHFRYLRHEQRLAFIDEIAREKLRTISVLTYKPSIGDPERYQSERFLLYKYTARLLLERVSWLCRDQRRTGEGDGSVELVFSDRAAMSYTSLQEYLRLLRMQAAYNDRVRIDWTVIDPSKVRATGHSKLAGLQIADAVASGHFYAANLSQYGHSEPRYADMLRHAAYAHRGARIGYGWKFWPDLPGLKAQMPHLAAFEC